MKKDINFHPVTGVKMAIAKKEINGVEEWAVYIINQNLIELNTLMITSKGFGLMHGEKKVTSTLRHMIQELAPLSTARVEPIDPQLFALNNEFWVSYYILDQVVDMKFVFVKGSMNIDNHSFIPELNLYGVLHT
jgi:hypothetical protein